MNSKQFKMKANFADAEAYEKRIRRFVPYYEEMMDSILDCLPRAHERCSFLELGCGTGNLTFKLLKKAGDAQIVALDIVKEMIEACKNRFANQKTRAEFICADMVEFFRPESFDFVFSSLALHYPEKNEDKFLTCRNVFKSLKPGGIFSFSVMLSSNFQEVTERNWKLWEKDVLENGVSKEELQEWYRTSHKTDHPVPLNFWFRWLKEAGFVARELVWRRTIFGTIRAARPEGEKYI